MATAQKSTPAPVASAPAPVASTVQPAPPGRLVPMEPVQSQAAAPLPPRPPSPPSIPVVQAPVDPQKTSHPARAKSPKGLDRRRADTSTDKYWENMVPRAPNVPPRVVTPPPLDRKGDDMSDDSGRRSKTPPPRTPRQPTRAATPPLPESARQAVQIAQHVVQPPAPQPRAPQLLVLSRETPDIHTEGFIPPTARMGQLYQYLYSKTLQVPDRSFNAYVGRTGPPHP